jgi:hypothetical protein
MQANAMIRFRCECGRELQARPADAGSPARCPVCAKIVTVPDEGAAHAGRGTSAGGLCVSPARPDGVAPAGAPSAPGEPDEDAPAWAARGPFAHRPLCPAADAAWIIALCALVCGPLALGVGPLAIVYGIVALRQIAARPELPGRRRAVVGICIGVLAMLLVSEFFFGVVSGLLP